MDWADGMSDDPVFPEMPADGPTEKTKNETASGHQYLDWAKRTGFTGGMGLHATRREALIKVDGKGYSLRTILWCSGILLQFCQVCSSPPRSPECLGGMVKFA